MDQQTFNTVVAVAAVVITLSFIIQAVMFIFIYVSMKKLTRAADAFRAKAEPIIDKVGPVIDQAQSTTVNVKGAVDKISKQAKETFEQVTVETRAVAAAVSTSAQEIANVARHQAEQISLTLDQATSTLQRQVVDLDRLLTRTQDRVEYTTMEVQSRVLDPIREVSALLVGIRRTMDALFNRDRKPIDQAYQDEEMFI